MKRALIIVDMQEDFFPDGALPVPGSWGIVEVVNRLLTWAARTGYYDQVVLTGDWHPRGHKAFSSSHPGKKPFDVLDGETLWPDHCVQETWGAEFFQGRKGIPDPDAPLGYLMDVPALLTQYADTIIRKGTRTDSHPYSAFCDNDGSSNPTGLARFLKGRGVTDVDVVGQTLPLCTSFTARHAHAAGFRTRVIEDACGKLDVTETAVQDDLNDMRRIGIRLKTSGEIIA